MSLVNELLNLGDWRLFMAKDPAFLFYPSDFLTGTMFMSNEQIGIYIRLLCSQHQHGGIIDKDSFNALVGANNLIRNKFIETESGFYNERLTIEMEKRNRKSNNMSETAKEVWKKRKEQKEYKSKENKYNCNTNVKENDTIVIQPVNENVNVNKDINKNKVKYINIQDIKDYFLEKGYSEIAAQKFYDYYYVANWCDSNGKKVKNWKQKAQSVWFKPENKIVDNSKPKMVW